MPMVRSSVLASAVIFAAAEPALSEFDLTRYAITQGGLLIVVLVLMYWQRIDNKNKHRENQDKISILTAIAERSAVASTASAAASSANATAINRLASAVERFQDRR